MGIFSRFVAKIKGESTASALDWDELSAELLAADDAADDAALLAADDAALAAVVAAALAAAAVACVTVV